MMAGPMGKVMEKKGDGFPFAALRPTLRNADIAFGNLECCIAATGKPIEKQFNFRAHPRTARALADAGFDIVSLANNHAWDYGRAAMLETVQRVEQAGVRTVGAGSNRAEAHQLRILKRKGMRIGFLAYLGLIPALLPESNREPSLAMAHVDTIRKEVQAARDKVDILIVSLHAGQEGATKQTPRQKSFATAAIDAGADLVIGHHPHVVQSLARYKGKYIAYSLGNFVFSAAGRGSGSLLEVTLAPDGAIRATQRLLNLSGAQPKFATASRENQTSKRQRAAVQKRNFR
jgi:poly-gamma-glutamate synthesis protein (capsule biosynthesis protein)